MNNASIPAKLRTWIFSGLLVLVPLIITLWVLDWVVTTLDQTLRILPQAWHPDEWMGIHIPGLGVIFALMIVLLMGAVASNFIGNKMVVVWHSLLNRIPVVRSIYSGVKQVSDTLFSEKGNAFHQALLVKWPHEGMWTIAFLTGKPGGDLQNYLVGDYLSVYVPTTPNPTGGYLVMVKRSDCIELDMSVDGALAYVISMGVIVPDGPKTLKPKSAAETGQLPNS